MSESKREQRRIALSCRRALSQEQRMRDSEAICQTLLRLPEVCQAGVVMSYAAMWDEPNLTRLHEWLWQQGKQVVFPVTEGDGIMTAVQAMPGCQWRAGRYGICEPIGPTIDPAEIELILTPCVAFDAQCHRLGHGGGYYDRFFMKYPQARCVVTAFEAQRLDVVCAEPLDHPADCVVTEKCVYKMCNEERNDGFNRKNTEK